MCCVSELPMNLPECEYEHATCIFIESLLKTSFQYPKSLQDKKRSARSCIVGRVVAHKAHYDWQYVQPCSRLFTVHFLCRKATHIIAFRIRHTFSHYQFLSLVKCTHAHSKPSSIRRTYQGIYALHFSMKAYDTHSNNVCILHTVIDALMKFHKWTESCSSSAI